MRTRRTIGMSLLLAAALANTGCGGKPTYPKEHLVESIQGLLVERQLNASVRLVDQTLAVHVHHADMLIQSGSQAELGPAFDEVARTVIGDVLHRVLLSTDADIRFYLLLMSDPNAPGLYLTIIRYVDDIKRANVNMIDVPEMLARTVFEWNYIGTASLSLEQYIPRGIRLEEFLSLQLAKRLQQTLAERLQTEGAANVGKFVGTYQNGEFALVLDVTPAQSNRPLDEAMMREVFDTATGVVAKVLSGYRFESFDTVRLIHPISGRNIVFHKASLKSFQ